MAARKQRYLSKPSILLQWILLLGFAGVLARVLLRSHPHPEYAPETWCSWEGVTVLSYAGIAFRDQPMYPSVQRLEEHLRALREAGYQTVRPEHVRAFLEGRSPLPEKALLLLFEGGRKEAVVRATALLQETGFSAVIAMPTSPTHTLGGFYLKPSDMRRVERIPQWRLGSMGHEAVEEIPVDAQQTPGRFLTRRRWREDGLEDSSAYQQRVLDDYARSAEMITAATARPAGVYLYPYADAGWFPGADPLAGEVNRTGVTRHYQLAFVGADDAFNGPASDPWSLSRLRVRGDWSADELLRQLSLSRPRPEGQPSLGHAEDWLLERGGEFLENSLTLPAGAAAWLRGSDGWTDVDVEATLSDRADGAGGVVALYARHASPRSWVRVSLASDGLRVQERLRDRTQTLLFQPWEEQEPRGEARLRLRLRNNRAWVWLDEAEVAAQLPLTTATRRGRIGFASENAGLTVVNLHADCLPARLALVNSIRLIPGEQHPRFRSVLPVWFRAEHPPRIAETHRQDLMRAAVAGIETIPVVSGAADLSPEAAAELAGQINGRLHDNGLQSLVLTLGVAGPAGELASALRSHGYRVVHLLSAAQAVRQGPLLARLDTEDWIVITDSGAEGGAALTRLLHHMPANRLAVAEQMEETEFGPALQTARMAEQQSPPKEE